jgi:hypothetical protein
MKITRKIIYQFLGVFALVMSILFVILFFIYQKISLADAVERNIPSQYKVYNQYEVNLDEDSRAEVLVLLEYDEFYNSDRVTEGEGFRFQPVKFVVFDFENLVWKSTELQNVNDDEHVNGFFTEKGIYGSKPYTIKEVEGEKILILFSHGSSFDGISYQVDLFRYRSGHSYRLEMRRVPIEESWSTEDIIIYDESLFFITCNMYDQYLDGTYNMKIRKLNLSSGFNTNDLTEVFDISCEEYDDQKDQATLKEFLKKKKVI